MVLFSHQQIYVHQNPKSGCRMKVGTIAVSVSRLNRIFFCCWLHYSVSSLPLSCTVAIFSQLPGVSLSRGCRSELSENEPGPATCCVPPWNGPSRAGRHVTPSLLPRVSQQELIAQTHLLRIHPHYICSTHFSPIIFHMFILWCIIFPL